MLFHANDNIERFFVLAKGEDDSQKDEKNCERVKYDFIYLKCRVYKKNDMNEIYHNYGSPYNFFIRKNQW